MRSTDRGNPAPGFQRLRITMEGLLSMFSIACHKRAELYEQIPNKIPFEELRTLVLDALRITGPLVCFKGKVLVKLKEGELVWRPARKPHKERYRDARTVFVPSSILGTILLPIEDLEDPEGN